MRWWPSSESEQAIRLKKPGLHKDLLPTTHVPSTGPGALQSAARANSCTMHHTRAPQTPRRWQVNTLSQRPRAALTSASICLATSAGVLSWPVIDWTPLVTASHEPFPKRICGAPSGSQEVISLMTGLSTRAAAETVDGMARDAFIVRV